MYDVSIRSRYIVLIGSNYKAIVRIDRSELHTLTAIESMYSTANRLMTVAAFVRETCVSRHNGSPIKGLPQTAQYDIALMV